MSSDLASSMRSRSLLSITKIRPWVPGRGDVSEGVSSLYVLWNVKYAACLDRGSTRVGLVIVLTVWYLRPEARDMFQMQSNEGIRT